MLKLLPVLAVRFPMPMPIPIPILMLFVLGGGAILNELLLAGFGGGILNPEYCFCACDGGGAIEKFEKLLVVFVVVEMDGVDEEPHGFVFVLVLKEVYDGVDEIPSAGIVC